MHPIITDACKLYNEAIRTFRRTMVFMRWMHTECITNCQSSNCYEQQAYQGRENCHQRPIERKSCYNKTHKQLNLCKEVGWVVIQTGDNRGIERILFSRCFEYPVGKHWVLLLFFPKRNGTKKHITSPNKAQYSTPNSQCK